MKGWIGVDLDGTLAEYSEWKGPEHIGNPIPIMVGRVKAWIQEGRDVRIFTARVGPADLSIVGEDYPAKVLAVIQDWAQVHIGKRLPVTATKDYGMVELWDDRAIQIHSNTGHRADFCHDCQQQTRPPAVHTQGGTT